MCSRLHNVLSRHAPRFPQPAHGIRVLSTPSDFYQSLLSGIARAKSRILLSSLYLGGGAQSSALARALLDAKRVRPSLQVTLVFDALRSARRDAALSTFEQLRPLIDADAARFYVHHNVNATGAYERLLPERWNELPGVHHIKLYMFDDEVCLSGANLSETYFTDRRDRYFWLRDAAPLAGHYERLFERVLLPHSHQVLPKAPPTLAGAHTHRSIESKFDVQLAAPTAGVVAVNEAARFRASLRGALERFVRDERAQVPASTASSDTWLYPSLQFGCANFHQDAQQLDDMLQSFEPESHLTLTSPYLNMTADFQRTVLANRSQSLTLLTASPRANGFFTAKGASRRVPAAYVLLERQFWDAAERAGKRFQLHEYARAGWTYHAKGLWYAPPGAGALPLLTLVGSGNFGARSLKRDTEAQVTLVTDNAALRQMLADEQAALVADSTLVPNRQYLDTERDHVVPFWVHCATRVARDVF
jgi:CDP-diacylglycerol--glycerol-3-phosphate 3-phosphatidyltransferase